jgi:hypothetical protein
VFLLGCYGCIFHGTEILARLFQNFGISGEGILNPPRYATARLSPRWCPTTNRNISSPTNLTFSREAQIPALEKLTYELISQLDNTVYIWCKTIRFLAISYGWAELSITKVNCIFVCPAANLQTLSYKERHSWRDENAPGNLNVF